MNTDLGSFDAIIHFIDNNSGLIVNKEPLSVENTVWSGCKVNKSEVHGLVIAVGKETRLIKNSKNIKVQKVTDLDDQVNLFSIILFIMMVIISVMNAFLQGQHKFGFRNFGIATMRFIILLSFLIPISLKLFLMIARFAYSQQISRDEEIEGTVCKNETIVDELGKIQVILSDKTGTITQNLMYMDKISIGEHTYSKHQFKNNVDSFYRGRKSEEGDRSTQLAIGLAVCNNVNMRVNEGEKFFDASSPDEIAMVEYFEEIGFEILERNDEIVRFKTPDGKEEKYRILETFPFESSRKRMGIIVESSKELILFVKGADIVMKTKTSNSDDKMFIEENTLALASEGLRTLVFASKKIDPKELETYKKRCKDNLLQGKRHLNEGLLQELEKNMTYLGITAVKDLLQENVSKSFAYIEQANIKLWILTGDKLETAKHICLSTGLAKRNRPIDVLQINSNEDFNEFTGISLSKSRYIRDKVLMIDGNLLAKMLKKDAVLFLKACFKFNYVCFARCTPAQKYEIANILKKKLKRIILAVGDGGNDVGMIQIANVGVGIYGREGNQAALAADFTINKFNYLCKLMFFHGRNAHRGISSISQFVLHRGLIISWLQEIFSALFFMISMPIFNGMMMMLYSGLFTCFPALSVVYDIDIKWEQFKDYLNNYKASGMGVSVKNFLIWNSISFYQAAAIFITAFYLFDNYLSNFVGITFTALILCETFNIMLLISRCSKMMLLSIVVTLLLYVLCVLIFRSSFKMNLFDPDFIWRVSVVFLVAWLPVFIVQRIFKYFNKDVNDLVN